MLLSPITERRCLNQAIIKISRVKADIMKTVLLHANDCNCKNEIAKAAEILKNGGLVAVPTETVYGLAGSAFSSEAVKKIYEAKGRPSDNPLIVHIADIHELDIIASEISPIAKKCMEEFWPGPFTAVVPKSDNIPSAVSGGLDTVAVRMPDNDVTRQIIRLSGLPLAAPSANRSGSPSPSTAAHVIDDLSGRIDAVVVSGDCAVGVESTVVSFAVTPPRLLRPGGITAEQLKKIIPDLVIDSAVISEPEKGAKVASPGMKYKHYSPEADVVMAVGSKADFISFCKKNSNNYELALCFDEDLDGLAVPALSLGASYDHERQAELLFSHLREIDKRGVKKVIVHAPDKDGMGLAVYNRLIRAAGFKVIEL